MACPFCAKKEKNRCRYQDTVNQALDGWRGRTALFSELPSTMPRRPDAYILYGPVFLRASGLAYKPAAAVAVARRGGNIGAFDQINRYFRFRMPIVPSQY
jgi:hypothetical protein